ncbi:hypothetical protein [Ekhidna sp.]|uniref:hypothetical protein n=1 Tax=Ekhidna sp. TaxID=2608089 RepID=UPI0032EE020B
MKLFILKTNIRTNWQARKLGIDLKKDKRIARWVVDLEDVDKVLKVETYMESEEREMIAYLKSLGISCEELPD